MRETDLGNADFSKGSFAGCRLGAAVFKTEQPFRARISEEPSTTPLTRQAIRSAKRDFRWKELPVYSIDRIVIDGH